MAVLWMEGFDNYGTGSQNGSGSTYIAPINNMSADGWSFVEPGTSNFNYTIGVPNWGPARTGANAFNRNSIGTGIWTRQINRSLPTPKTHIFVSLGFACDALPINSSSVLQFYTSGGSGLYKLLVTPSGALEMYDLGTSSTIAVSSSAVIVPNTWFFIEMELNTAGNWTIRVNDPTGTETPLLQGALAGGSIGIIRLGPSLSAEQASFWWDDIIVRDTSGGVNDGWLGDRRVATMYPINDTSEDGWTPQFYKEISPGIARFAYNFTGLSSVQNTTASIATASNANLNLGAADFSLETWARFDSLPTTTQVATLISRWNESNTTGRSYQLRYTGPSDGNVLEFRTSTDGQSGTVASKIRYPWSPNVGQWYHVAVCRSSGNLLLFVDGKQLGLPIPDSDTYHPTTTAALGIGSQVNGTSASTSGVSGTTLVGRLDETRMTVGVSRYSSSFIINKEMFPRGAGSDPDWSSTVLLLGYDGSITDESSYARSMSANGSATDILPTDGDPPGAWTTVGGAKAIPDDNTFIRASYTNASNVLTLTTNPSASDTITVGTTDGSTPAVYEFVSSLSAAYDVLIGATAQDTLTNLLNAINAGPGEGTTYGTGTLANADVGAFSLPVGQIGVNALLPGTSGNSIACSSSSPGTWDTATLEGGLDIPGPSAFKFERPPSNTTLISAVQINTRAKKTDSGVGSFRVGLVGPLGGVTNGATHNLSVQGAVYHDVIESDPDTSGPISPTTLINGKVRINRQS